MANQADHTRPVWLFNEAGENESLWFIDRRWATSGMGGLTPGNAWPLSIGLARDTFSSLFPKGVGLPSPHSQPRRILIVVAPAVYGDLRIGKDICQRINWTWCSRRCILAQVGISHRSLD